MIAIVAGDEVRAPAPGWFRLLVAADHLVAPGDVIGELEVLGRIEKLVAPNVHGLVAIDAAASREAHRAVGYGDVLFRVVAADARVVARAAGAAAGAAAAATSAQGLVFRAPTSGRFYGRPSPDKPPFVAPGAELAAGTTICLLEVMKTFHRVTYSGAELPPRAKVRAVLVAEGADVNAGEPLLALEP